MEIFDGFRQMPPHQLMLWGAPILKEKAIDEALNKKVEAFDRAISRLALLDPHDSLCLLKNSISIPKLLFVLDMSDCCTHPVLIRYDEVLGEGLISISNMDLNNGLKSPYQSNEEDWESEVASCWHHLSLRLCCRHSHSLECHPSSCLTAIDRMKQLMHLCKCSLVCPGQTSRQAHLPKSRKPETAS